MLLKGLYGITNEKLLSDEAKCYTSVSQALSGGMKILQYRDKISDKLTALNYAQNLKQLCHNNDALFIVNDDVELALKIQADGVHLGQKDQCLSQARNLLGSKIIIGVSCSNSITLAEQAIAEGANYISFGRFFPSSTKPQAPQAELATLITARKKLAVPIVAIGGINSKNADLIVNCGVDSIAVSQGLFASKDIYKTSNLLSGKF